MRTPVTRSTRATAAHAAHAVPAAPRRVRDEARERLVLMAFSAAVSVGGASALLLLGRLGN